LEKTLKGHEKRKGEQRRIYKREKNGGPVAA